MKLLLAIHSAHADGAQLLGLNLARRLAAGNDLTIALLSGGVLVDSFQEVAPTTVLADMRELEELLDQSDPKIEVALCNSIATGSVVPECASRGIPTVVLVHEMTGVVAAFGLEGQWQNVSQYASRVVYPASIVASQFDDLGARTIIRPQGIYKLNSYMGDAICEPRAQLRSDLGVSESTSIVLGSGYADSRKGFDIFVRLSLALKARRPDVQFVWLGRVDEALEVPDQGELVRSAVASGSLVTPGFVWNTDAYFAGADVFALTSREDPFPSVVLESLSVGVPVVSFEASGGARDLLTRGCGVLATEGDETDFADQIEGLLSDRDLSTALGSVGRQLVADEFDFDAYVRFLTDVLIDAIRS